MQGTLVMFPQELSSLSGKSSLMTEIFPLSFLFAKISSSYLASVREVYISAIPFVKIKTKAITVLFLTKAMSAYPCRPSEMSRNLVLHFRLSCSRLQFQR